VLRDPEGRIEAVRFDAHGCATLAWHALLDSLPPS